jgi:type II secretory pathway pseudopilin PulG
MKKAIIIRKNRQRQQGFTLVELSMSLVFIAFIILFLTTTLLDIMRTYNKGIWLNQINLTGRQINADIGDQVRFSSSAIIVKPANEQRLCVGNVTYIWNTGSSYRNKYSEETSVDLSKPDSAKTTKLRFARVLDSTGEYCNDSSKMPKRNDSNTSALLGPGVIIQKFDATVGTSGLLRILAVFSTENDVQPDYNPDTKHYQCKIAGKFTTDNNQFCAFAEFDIIVYRRIGE